MQENQRLKLKEESLIKIEHEMTKGKFDHFEQKEGHSNNYKQ